jgi:hypothetical protein
MTVWPPCATMKSFTFDGGATPTWLRPMKCSARSYLAALLVGVPLALLVPFEAMSATGTPMYWCVDSGGTRSICLWGEGKLGGRSWVQISADLVEIKTSGALANQSAQRVLLLLTAFIIRYDFVAQLKQRLARGNSTVYMRVSRRNVAKRRRVVCVRRCR